MSGQHKDSSQHKGQNEGRENLDIEQGKITPDAVREATEALREQSIADNESKGLFTVKTGNRWIEQAKTRPIPKMLFDEFWYQGELCILFAETGAGKSILAVQIGNSISRGQQIRGFRLEASKQPILYFDFELSEKQFENRYSLEFSDHYIWDDNFVRVEINPDAEIPSVQTFEEYLNESLERSIIEIGAQVLIIDNLTYLRGENEKAKDALPLMKHLKALKSKYGLSILALAHTPKRDLAKPLTRNDIQGSKMLANFMDSSFAIGESQRDKNIRYLKQIKVRQTEFLFDAENVCICLIEKPHNFLQFSFLDFGSERDHLKEITEKDKGNLLAKAIELKQQGKSLREIGAAIGLSHTQVARILKDCNTL